MSEACVESFAAYVASLERLLREAEESPALRKRRSMLRDSLNGEVARQFRLLVPLETRRANGAFFTGTKLARQLAKRVMVDLLPNAVIADPTCGAGDLLLAIAEKLPIRRSLDKTLETWGERLIGLDINPQFVRVAKIRLLMLALTRFPQARLPSIPPIQDLFPSIAEADFLSSPKTISRASHILINPPYGEMDAPSKCGWGSGHVSAAAVFVETCLSNIREGTKVGAILPDVLRSGSYYAKWREHIQSSGTEVQVSTHGQFDDTTDVDVFLLQLTKGRQRRSRKICWWRSNRKAHVGKVGDYFDIHVGSVVPHRDPLDGPCVPYIHPRTLPAWGNRQRIGQRRKFDGKLFQPPFVVVRRTSRPGDKRAIATLVTGKRKVAAENHLLVLSPKNGTLSACVRLVRVLRKDQTDVWLNERIRCRHLTVKALMDLPWWRPPK
jgi:hypothetical protein